MTGSGDPHRDPGEAELLRRAQAGDEQAFAMLFDRHAQALQGRLERKLPRTVRRKVSVSDLIQETRIVALGRLGDYEEWPDGAFGAWVDRIAKNKLRDAVRRYEGTVKRGAVREVSRGERPDTALFEAKGTSPSQGAARTDLRRHLLALMEDLPEDYREVMQLVYMKQLPLAEAAKRMGRSLEATKKLRARALVRFTALCRAKGLTASC
ncbi:MAG: sigma-70 family RNA polymerase sigma factor [Planctomycetota bacterium]|nr:sigma-70 family RNA polymerase sigma factor [Planctomycetota bacterium]